MKQFILDLFSDSSHVSMMRFLSLLCVLTACGIAIHNAATGQDLNGISMLCGTFLGAGIGGKVAQKVAEVKSGQ